MCGVTPDTNKNNNGDGNRSFRAVPEFVRAQKARPLSSPQQSDDRHARMPFVFCDQVAGLAVSGSLQCLANDRRRPLPGGVRQEVACWKTNTPDEAMHGHRDSRALWVELAKDM